MKFQILSHAGLMVEHNGVQLLCDPWLIGSTYWRSWWNYPPVSKDLIESLRPDYIYITHIHWDHFQSVSLKLFPKGTRFLCPKGHFSRIKRDLNQCGFHNVTELNHGQKVELGPDFHLTSYSFDLLCDSAVVLQNRQTTLLNLNDCKIMGRPLQHLLSRHDRPDFVFCSHSSANSRACFHVIDDDSYEPDDSQKYIERFYQFAATTRARYAVPFASNQCYLHPETFRFNDSSRTPVMVGDYWESHDIRTPKLKVMVSGDSWSEQDGFEYTGEDWFTNRNDRLIEYQQQQAAKLRSFSEKEARAQVPLSMMQRFFQKFFRAIPYLVRRTFRNHPIVYVLKAGEQRTYYRVDIYNRTVTELDEVNDIDHPLQIHMAANIMRHSLAMNILAHIGISKRVQYRVTKAEKPYAERYKLLVDLCEYEILPLRNMLRPRSILNWMRRWRELLLYAVLLKDKALTGELKIEKHLVKALPQIPPQIDHVGEDQEVPVLAGDSP